MVKCAGLAVVVIGGGVAVGSGGGGGSAVDEWKADIDCMDQDELRTRVVYYRWKW